MATLTLTKQPALSLEKLPLESPVSGDTLHSSALHTLALKYRAMDVIASTPELLEEARGWLADCTGEPLEDTPADRVALRVQTYYDGGAIGFYLASRTLAPVITRTN